MVDGTVHDVRSVNSVANYIEAAIQLATATSWTETTNTTSDTYRYVNQASNQLKWLYFKWGLRIGALAVTAIVITILVMAHH